MPTFKGKCRIRGENGAPNCVRVTDGDMVWEDIEETEYRRACIQPPFDDLPWCGESIAPHNQRPSS